MGIFRNGASTPGTNQTFTTSTANTANSNSVGFGTSIIRIATTSDVYCNLWSGGGNVTATANNMILPAGSVSLFTTQEGITQVGFLAITANGNISITEL